MKRCPRSPTSASLGISTAPGPGRPRGAPSWARLRTCPPSRVPARWQLAEDAGSRARGKAEEEARAKEAALRAEQGAREMGQLEKLAREKAQQAADEARAERRKAQEAAERARRSLTLRNLSLA